MERNDPISYTMSSGPAEVRARPQTDQTVSRLRRDHAARGDRHQHGSAHLHDPLSQPQVELLDYHQRARFHT